MRAPVDLGDARLDFEQVVDARRLEEFHVIRRTAKASGSPMLARVERVMADAEQAQEIGPSALHEAEVAGVIDDAGEVGVLEIDAHRQDMAATASAGKVARPGIRPQTVVGHWPSGVRL